MLVAVDRLLVAVEDLLAALRVERAVVQLALLKALHDLADGLAYLLRLIDERVEAREHETLDRLSARDRGGASGSEPDAPPRRR